MTAAQRSALANVFGRVFTREAMDPEVVCFYNNNSDIVLKANAHRLVPSGMFVGRASMRPNGMSEMFRDAEGYGSQDVTLSTSLSPSSLYLLNANLLSEVEFLTDAGWVAVAPEQP